MIAAVREITSPVRRRLVKAVRICRRQRLSAGATLTYAYMVTKAGGWRRIVRVSEAEIAQALTQWAEVHGPLTWENVLRWETALRSD
jgi:hypothetical protein